VIEAKFLFELLVRLFTDPSGFNRGGQHLDGGIGGQVRDVIFLLASRAPLADEPHLLARHALYTIIKHPMLMAVGHSNTAGGKLACQATFRALTPGDLFPFLPGQHELGGDRRPVRDVVFTAFAGFRDGESQRSIGRIDVLAP